LSVALLLLFFWTMLRLRHGSGASPGRGVALGAGLLTGLLFSVRYGLVPVLGLGILFIAIEVRHRGELLKTLLLYLVGFAVPAYLVLARNLAAGGSLLPPALPSDRGLVANASDAVVSVTATWLWPSTRTGQSLLSLVVVTGVLVAIFVRHRGSEILRSALIGGGAYCLTLWSVGYLAFVVVLRSLVHFDAIGSRITIPAGIVLLMLFSALAARAFLEGIGSARIGCFILAALLTIAIVREIRSIHQYEVYDPGEVIRGSERLKWLADNTDEDDLIIGDATVDASFYLDRATVSFSQYPYTAHVTYDALMEFARENRARYRHIYLVLRSSDLGEEEQIYRFGRFVTDARRGVLQGYSGVFPICRLEDARVFGLLDG
jgi:hypothetical protein